MRHAGRVAAFAFLLLASELPAFEMDLGAGITIDVAPFGVESVEPLVDPRPVGRSARRSAGGRDAGRLVRRGHVGCGAGIVREAMADQQHPGSVRRGRDSRCARTGPLW